MPSKQPTLITRAAHDRGEVLIEFALSAAMFFLLTIGTVELGLIVWRYNFVASLAMEGARWAAVRGSTSSTPASVADVETYVRSRALGRTVTVTTTPVPSTIDPGGTVDVQVQESMTPLSSFLPSVTFQLAGTSRMVVVR